MFIGIQSQKLTREGLGFCITADVRTFRAINDAHNPTLLWEMKRALPRCKFGLRLVRDINWGDPYESAERFYDALRPKLLEFPYDFVSGANETGYFHNTSLLYDAFTETLIMQLRYDSDEQVRRVLYGGFDFGVTWPNVALLGDYAAGLRDSDMLFMHGYMLPHNSDENTIYHHRRVRAALPADLRDKPIWYSEFGLDAEGREGDGWSGPIWGWSPENYAVWLRQTAARLTDVEHGIIFLGEEVDPKWRSWRIVGHDVIAQAIAQANREEDARRAAVVPEKPEFIFAFKALADELGADVVGEPLENQGPQNYDAFKNVQLFTSKGVMVYNERLNKAHFLPAALPKA